MHLIAGLPPPVDMRLFLHGFQEFFPSKKWKPTPQLYLPLVAFERLTPPHLGGTGPDSVLTPDARPRLASAYGL